MLPHNYFSPGDIPLGPISNSCKRSSTLCSDLVCIIILLCVYVCQIILTFTGRHLKSAVAMPAVAMPAVAMPAVAMPAVAMPAVAMPAVSGYSHTDVLSHYSVSGVVPISYTSCRKYVQCQWWN